MPVPCVGSERVKGGVDSGVVHPPLHAGDRSLCPVTGLQLMFFLFLFFFYCNHTLPLHCNQVIYCLKEPKLTDYYLTFL